MADAVNNDPFAKTEYMVLEFDPHTAKVSVVTSVRAGAAYSVRNRQDAIDDARAAADRAAADGLPLRYAAVRIETVEAFPA